MRTRRRLFVTVRLAVLLTLIGILTTLASFSLTRYKLRETAKEALKNIENIRAAEERFFALFGFYVPAWPRPHGEASSAQRFWDNRVATRFHGFDIIKFRPQPLTVYYTYQVVVLRDRPSFAILAEGDIDGDGAKSRFGFLKHGNEVERQALASHIRCELPNGTAGPCDHASGRTVF